MTTPRNEIEIHAADISQKLLGDSDNYLHFGDCIPHMFSMPDRCIDMSVFSVPFPSVFSYSQLENDIGNSDDLKNETKLHFSWFFRSIIKVMKPGRVMAVHCTQIHRQKRDGELGLYDFRGLLIRLAIRAGFIYDYDWLIRQNPQAQAIRTRKWELKFQGLESDRSVSRGSMGDYVIKFRAPGKNEVPIDAEHGGIVSRNEWIDWAEGCWDDIKMSDTLNVKVAKGPDDTKHLCPLQLGIIERLVKLYSNPGEIVFSPFAGIASELYKALLLGRRAYGCELKQEYYDAALKNIERAIKMRDEESKSLFDGIKDVEPEENEAERYSVDSLDSEEQDAVECNETSSQSELACD